uniref:KPN_02809 family neutral zinc metallopeptidase n=1 Tax=Maribacter algicola TaxID=2498892 RepID=UPI001FB44CFE|nr:neutral zinc metallopeptidase [Maribacter algicola]
MIIVGLFLVFSFVTGNNPLTLISNLLSVGVTQSAPSGNYEGTTEENKLADLSAVVLTSTEDVWNNTLGNYRASTLVLFSGYVSSAPGSVSSANGPFYRPGDEKLYLDLSFFEEMERQLNAPGDFAQAYVIAHEVGRHIQKLTGISDKIDRLRGQLSKTEFNKYSVPLELQADFLAGVWANRSKQLMESGDLQEALNAAHAIEDDRLQKQSSGRVVPDSFTHGTSEQHMRWFKKGYETGDISQGDIFSAESL